MVRTRSRGQPSATACSAKAYCRAVDSRFSSTCLGDDCRTYTTASRSWWAGWTFAELARPAGGIGGENAGLAVGVCSADFMRHLLVAGRCRKLLGDDLAEDLERT